MNTNRIQDGEYAGTVVRSILRVFGAVKEIITTIKLAEEDRQVTHVVRLTNPNTTPDKAKMARDIGLQELRSAFPNQLGLKSDKDMVLAIGDGAISNRPVVAAIVSQKKNGVPVKLQNGETAYNVRLYAADKASAETLSATLDSVFGETADDAAFE